MNFRVGDIVYHKHNVGRIIEISKDKNFIKIGSTTLMASFRTDYGKMLWDALFNAPHNNVWISTKMIRHATKKEIIAFTLCQMGGGDCTVSSK